MKSPPSQWGALIGAMVLAGCTPKNGLNSEDAVALMKQLAPASKLPVDGILELPGAKIPVTVESALKGEAFTVQLTTFGEALETEKYVAAPDRFALQEALGEMYDPEPPLLGAGTHTNDSWKWKGVISSGGINRKATAEIFGKSIALELVGYKGPGRVVTMELKIDSGESVKAARTLSFYFAEKRGLLKRDFGQASTRIPAEPEGAANGSSEEKK